MDAQTYLEGHGMTDTNTVLVSFIDGTVRNPDIKTLLEDYAAIKIKALDLKLIPGGGLENFFEKQEIPVELNVFGRKIIIEPRAKVITVSKIYENIVELKAQFQNECYQTNSIDTLRIYNKTADEFISEFHKQNYNACKSSGEISFTGED